MIQILAGGKGEGKTKRLIEMANNSMKVSNGHIVFIDDDKRHMYDLHYDVRFIETTDFPISSYKEFLGFVCGILSQDRDVAQMYIDGIGNIIKKITTDELSKLLEKLETVSEIHSVDFIITINCKTDEMPENLRSYMVA